MLVRDDCPVRPEIIDEIPNIRRTNIRVQDSYDRANAVERVGKHKHVGTVREQATHAVTGPYAQSPHPAGDALDLRKE
jgi:hypothetical protein